MDFIDELKWRGMINDLTPGLKEHLSPSRANGLGSMIKQLKMYAIAYQTKLS